MSCDSFTHIWAAEPEVHDAQWVPTMSFRRQYDECHVLTLVLVDVDRIYIQCERLVLPDVEVLVFGSPHVFAVLIAAGHDVTGVLGSRKQDAKSLFEGPLITPHYELVSDVMQIRVVITHNKCTSGKGPPEPVRGSVASGSDVVPPSPVAMENGHGLPHSLGGGTQPSGFPRPATAVKVKSPLWRRLTIPSTSPIMAMVPGSVATSLTTVGVVELLSAGIVTFSLKCLGVKESGSSPTRALAKPRVFTRYKLSTCRQRVQLGDVLSRGTGPFINIFPLNKTSLISLHGGRWILRSTYLQMIALAKLGVR